ncbi:MAG TPA: CHAT domain-containing protein [Ohtaekwangia sp.]|nr:CHAT domain-containing protein [Ohtaekwangia sp.]
MRTRFVFTYSYIFLFTCIGLQAYSQCNTTQTEWFGKVLLIEQGTEDNAVKIDRFLQLQKRYLKCHAEPDSIYARISHRLGDLYRLSGDFEKGIELTREAVRINRSKTPGVQQAFLAHSYYNLGLYFSLLYLQDQSHAYYDSCIVVATRYPQKSFIAQMAFEQKAFLFFQSGDYQESIETADLGIYEARKYDSRIDEALLLMQKIQAELELNRLEDSKINSRKVIDIFTKEGGSYYLGNAYALLANVLSKKSQYNESIRYYKKAYEENVKLGKWSQSIRDLQDLGFLYHMEINNADAALKCYAYAIDLAKQKDDHFTLAALYNNMGSVCHGKKQYKKAIDYFNRALHSLPLHFSDTALLALPSNEQIKWIGNDQIGMILLANKGEVLLDYYRANHNADYLQAALNTFKKFDLAIDYMRWGQSGDQSKLYWRERTKKWYAMALEVCYLLNDPEQAFYFLEKSRAVLLNDRLNELNAKTRLSEEDAAREQQLRMEAHAVEQRLSLVEITAPAYETLYRQYAVARQNLEDFISMLEVKYPVYYQYKYDRSVCSIETLRSKLLNDNRAVVSYFNSHEVVYALVVTRGTLSFKKIPYPDKKKLAMQILAMTADRHVLNQNFDQYRKLSVECFNTLFKPLDVQAEYVTILQDEYFIPFEALVTNTEGPPHFLLEDHVFSYAYSVSSLLNGQRTKQVTPRTLAVAPVAYNTSPKLVSLRGADKAMENMKSGNSEVSLILREAATRQAFMNSLPAFNIVHLFSHATVGETGNEPMLYLYDSAVKVSDLQTLGSLNTRLITLFACNTGTGKRISGEGTFSLARGFAAAGIPATITTLWEIDNMATYSLSSLFFQNIYKGMPTDKALQQAKIDFIKSGDKVYELPYYWAAGVLIGNPEQFKVQEKSHTGFINKKVFLFVFVALILLVFLFSISMRRHSGFFK